MKYIFVFSIIFNLSLSLASDDPVNLLKTIGFTPTNQTLMNVEANDLNGNPINLDRLKGSYIMLNFWATWCGYCKKELPSLESLYVEFKSSNLKILGISVDQGARDQVNKFVKQHSLSFPIIHDQYGEISKNFDASSVPVHYLISPTQKIIGVLRGAINWEDARVIQSLKQLVSLKNIDTDNFSKNSTPLPDIPKLLPPEIEGKVVDGNLHISLSLSENVNDYIINTPQIKLPSDITYENVSSSSEGGLDKSRIEYIFYLNVRKKASYSIGPIEVKYRSIYGGEEMTATHPGFSYDFNTPISNKLTYILIFLCSLFLVSMIFVLRKFIFKKTNIPVNSNIDFSSYRTEFNYIKNLRVSGENKDYQKKLIHLYKQILLKTHQKDDKVDNLIEEISYGGKSLEPMEAANFEKKIDRMINSEKYEEI